MRRDLPLWRKLFLVIGGYITAFVVATGIAGLNAALTPESEHSASPGMTAFGDVLVFIFVFCPLALVPTAMAVYFLWPRRKAG